MSASGTPQGDAPTSRIGRKPAISAQRIDNPLQGETGISAPVQDWRLLQAQYHDQLVVLSAVTNEAVWNAANL